MGIAIRKEGFVTAGQITLDIIDTMIANGFTPKYPLNNTEYAKPDLSKGENFIVVLEASGTVDPLNKEEVTSKQPWRVAFRVSDNATLNIICGSAAALPDSGQQPYTTASVAESSSTITRIVGAKGVVGSDLTPYKVNQQARTLYFNSAELFQPHWNSKDEGFINRRTKVWVGSSSKSSSETESPPVYPVDPKNDVSSTYPMSYQLSITPRGFYLSIWEGSAANMDGTDFSWMLVQRPVQRDTGIVVTDGKAPVFCVNSVGNIINRFVVRESDVVDASKSILAAKDTKDGTAIINEKKQIGVSENNQYIVNYPSRLNTPRYAYTYELDMIGYTSATVVSPSTTVPQTLYGEEAERTYIGMHSNQPANNGMRILVLQAGGGI